ncbi:MAG: hypothetical protein A2Y16_03205 [Tenericutes bacterium GWF2_57_13]|nr:MAG: hypothetical protein A2Y16_03205 [Tenericutes bacterium GWF2_57_13]
MFQKIDLSIGDWILYYILMSIPIVNIVIFFVILFNRDTNLTLRNMLITSLIMMAVGFLLMITLFMPFIYQIIEALQNSFPY